MRHSRALLIAVASIAAIAVGYLLLRSYAFSHRMKLAEEEYFKSRPGFREGVESYQFKSMGITYGMNEPTVNQRLAPRAQEVLRGLKDVDDTSKAGFKNCYVYMYGQSEEGSAARPLITEYVIVEFSETSRAIRITRRVYRQDGRRTPSEVFDLRR